MKSLFIVGAQRSGSTYLKEILGSHPQIAMAHSVKAEPKFFLDEELVGKGKSYYEKLYFHSLQPTTSLIGEKSTSYLESEEVAIRIKSFYPDAYILIILRNPIFRAYSNYLFSKFNMLESLDFGDALEFEKERIAKKRFNTSVCPWAYVQRGHYINYIQHYANLFNRDNIKIIIFEELINNLSTVRNLYNWLGIETAFSPPALEKIINPGTKLNDYPRSEFVNLISKFANSISQLEEWLGRRVDVWHNQNNSIISNKLKMCTLYSK